MCGCIYLKCFLSKEHIVSIDFESPKNRLWIFILKYFPGYVHTG